MWWRRHRRKATHRPVPTGTDYGAASGRHRLRDGDVVPVAGYRRYSAILNDRTRELPAVTIDRPLFTPGQEQRGGIRNWLAS